MLFRILSAGSNFPKKNKPSIHLKCSVVFLYKNKYRYYFAAGGGAGAAGAGAPGAGAGAPGAGAGAAASFFAGSAGFFSGADGQPTNVSVNAINISTERMKANTFFINLVPPFKNFQTLGVKPIPLVWQNTPFYPLVKLKLSIIF